MTSSLATRRIGRLITSAIAALVLLMLTAHPERVRAVEGAKAVASPFGGNGHTVSFDGRLMIVRTSQVRSPIGSWSHIAFTYDAATGGMGFFIVTD